MTDGEVARGLATLPLEAVAGVVDALPHAHYLAVREACQDRRWRQRCAQLPPPAPVVVTSPAADPEQILTADEAATFLRISRDTLYRMVERHALEALPRPRGGRLKFRRGAVLAVAASVDRRYTPPHDTPRRQSPPGPTALDSTRARPRPRRDRDDRRPLGARRAERNTPRRGEPYAPSQATWRDPPEPKG